MTFSESTVLGRTGLKTGRLGVASGYWAPTGAIEEAFERGCNYMTWGTVIKGYSPHMRQNLELLGLGPITEEELARVRGIGDHIYGRRKPPG